MDISPISGSPLMLIMSNTAPSPTGSILELPYDVLLEIFTHCLLRYPLRQRQPSTQTAPILLCHVCSTWRRLALASATLWTHLSYDFTVKIGGTSSSPSWTGGCQERDIEFIRWWKVNHGQVAPFLSFRVGKWHPIQQKGESNSAFLLDYITSAQYLDLDHFFWKRLLAVQHAGHRLSFPYLHTALTKHIQSGNNPLQELQTLLSPETLRRLSFCEHRVPASDFTPPTHWAALTHISLLYALSLPAWQSLIRALPHLQWGHFELIPTPPFDITHDMSPQRSVLQKLSTLSISMHGNRDAFPLSLLFTALHLPTLRSLSLRACGANPWGDAHVLSELYTILGSMPAIEMLMLQESSSVHSNNLPPMIQATAPIWACAPHLAHIQLGLPVGRLIATVSDSKQGLAFFIRYIFSSKWLDLQNPASPVRKVTIATSNSRMHRTSEVVMASVRECRLEVPGVVLELSMLRWLDVAEDVPRPKEWGARI